MSTRADELIRTLGLARHPERGFYAETYRAPLAVPAPPGAARGGLAGATRAASTAIYFLLTSADRATYLHRLRSDELFHLYEGGPLDVLLLPGARDADGGGGAADARVARLGRDVAAGERPQLAIPAGTWFGTELAAGSEHCLWGCTVAPGFDFADFELAEGPELAARWPGYADRIARMSRSVATP